MLNHPLPPYPLGLLLFCRNCQIPESFRQDARQLDARRIDAGRIGKIVENLVTKYLKSLKFKVCVT